MGFYKQAEIENQELNLDTWEDIEFKRNMEEEQLLQVERDETMLTYPIGGKAYDVTTNQGNIHKNIVFLGYSNGVAKPKYLFKKENGNTVSVNPSYEVEMEQIN